MKKALGLTLVCLAAAGVSIHATDWPEFRGEGRLGVWNETGIVETFPAEGLPVLWRTPIKAGFSGPAVADGRVFVTDFDPIEPGEAPPPDAGVLAGALNRFSGMERAHALDEETGEVLWTRQWLNRLRPTGLQLGQQPGRLQTRLLSDGLLPGRKRCGTGARCS